ncbi:MAG: hypothetical protein J6Q78_06745 [Clostridia bacterium]|nr:hypothetical protein [Clostridia bacterium]
MKNTKNDSIFKNTAALMTFISLALTILSWIPYFLRYNTGLGYNEYFKEYINQGKYYKSYNMFFSFPTVEEFISILIGLIPCILLIVYLLAFHKKTKAICMIPITLGFMAFTNIFNILVSIPFVNSDIISTVLSLCLIVALVFATISSLNGFSKKIYIIIASSIGLLAALISLFDYFNTLDFYLNIMKKNNPDIIVYLLTRPAKILGNAALYVALLLFGLKNKIPPIISLTFSKNKANKDHNETNLEKALVVLKFKFEEDIITEEEYKTERTKILEKL